MAVSKKQKTKQGGDGPDAAAFVRLIDEGLAEPSDVARAYFQALSEHNAEKTYTELLREAFADGGVVSERPIVDPNEEPSPEGRLIALRRSLLIFKGRDA